jgi:hypothetical protein
MAFSSDTVRNLRCAAVATISLEIWFSDLAVAESPVGPLQRLDCCVSHQRGRGDVVPIAERAGEIIVNGVATLAAFGAVFLGFDLARTSRWRPDGTP